MNFFSSVAGYFKTSSSTLSAFDPSEYVVVEYDPKKREAREEKKNIIAYLDRKSVYVEVHKKPIEGMAFTFLQDVPRCLFYLNGQRITKDNLEPLKKAIPDENFRLKITSNAQQGNMVKYMQILNLSHVQNCEFEYHINNGSNNSIDVSTVFKCKNAVDEKLYRAIEKSTFYPDQESQISDITLFKPE